jgi:hypothetical protein
MSGRLEAGGPPDAAARMREVGKWRAMVERLLGFKRALSQKPDGLCLDEATAAVDEATEACLYRRPRSASATGGRCARSTPATSWCSPMAAASLLS